MMKNQNRYARILQHSTQALIAAFAFFALRDCIVRSNAGGLEAPGAGMVVFSLAIAAILAGKALWYWKSKIPGAKEQAAILCSLIVEVFFWHMFQHSSGSLLFFFFNIPLWAATCIWSLNSTFSRKYNNGFLILYFCKGAALAAFSNGALRAPWLIGVDRDWIILSLLAIPSFVAAFYQMFLLGVIWHLREKKDKAAKHTER